MKNLASLFNFINLLKKFNSIIKSIVEVKKKVENQRKIMTQSLEDIKNNLNIRQTSLFLLNLENVLKFSFQFKFKWAKV